VTNLPGADLNSSAGPKGGGQDARNKVRQDTPYRRLATNGGEKCGLGPPVSALSVFSSTDRAGATFKNHRVTPTALLLSDTFADTNLAKSMAQV
jgi:hypothetical protein